MAIFETQSRTLSMTNVIMMGEYGTVTTVPYKGD